jgi:hypothetical protein
MGTTAFAGGRTGRASVRTRSRPVRLLAASAARDVEGRVGRRSTLLPFSLRRWSHSWWLGSVTNGRFVGCVTQLKPATRHTPLFCIPGHGRDPFIIRGGGNCVG